MFANRLFGKVVEVQLVIFIGADGDIVVDQFLEGIPGEIGYALGPNLSRRADA